MAWYNNIGSTVGGFFGQQDDELKKAMSGVANMKNTQAILSQGADTATPAIGSQAQILAAENAGMGLSPEESQQQIASSIGTPNVENVDLADKSSWDLKGMAQAFLGGEEAKPEPMVTSGKLMRGSGNAVQPIEPMMPQAKPQQSQAANAIMMAMQQNQQNQPQVVQQQQPSMFQKMMGFA